MSQPTLAADIKAFQDKLIPTIPEKTMDTLMSELQQLVATGLAEKALKAGDKFPDFELPNANNQPLTLQSLCAKGPVVLSFYRGAWCPYCNLEINALQQRLPEISKAGGQLVAISPQTPDKSEDQVNRTNLSFEVLSDIGNKLARQARLVFTLPEPLRPIYEAWQLDIPGHNDDQTFELPMPATYIIDTDGIIRYSFVDMDYTKRLEPNIIIEQLERL